MEDDQNKLDLLKWMLSDQKKRRRFIKEYLLRGVQNVHTPFTLCSEMIGKLKENLEKDGKNIKEQRLFVICNVEFVEVLVHDFGVLPQNISFFGDSKTEAIFTKKVYNVGTAYVGTSGSKTLLENLGIVGRIDMKKEKPLQVVIMNPPYQKMDGGNAASATPVYHKFIEKIIDDLKPDYLLSVNPSRWMIGGKGLDGFRKRMAADRRVKAVVDSMSTSDIFPDVDIAGGVNYFLWAKNYNGKCSFNGIERFLDEEDIILRENECRSILQKVKTETKKWIGAGVSPRKPYGFEGDTPASKTGTPCWFKQSIGLSFVNASLVKNQRKDLHLWKILVPRAPIAGQTDLSKPIAFFNDDNIIVAKPNECCTETYIVLKSFGTEKEAKHFVSYLKTKFFRFMLRIRVVSQDITRECYNWVPDVEDYSKPLTDTELYTKFGLDTQEITYIESKIKELK